jgi:hypothetical protein
VYAGNLPRRGVRDDQGLERLSAGGNSDLFPAPRVLRMFLLTLGRRLGLIWRRPSLLPWLSDPIDPVDLPTSRLSLGGEGLLRAILE